MGHVDIRERWAEERASARRARENLGYGSVTNLFLYVAVVLGVLASWFALTYLFEDGLLAVIAMLSLSLVVALVRRTLQSGVRRLPGRQTGHGAEKQLLLALRESGGLTAVEAALETSLTVDEADETLSRLAERGHLLVGSRDGVLSYTLPGKHPVDRTGTLREPEGQTS